MPIQAPLDPESTPVWGDRVLVFRPLKYWKPFRCRQRILNSFELYVP
jgi:hypothetical protein